MDTNYTQEITELHQFFQDYFTGNIPFEGVSRFDLTLADGFTLIDSAAEIIQHDEIKQIMRQLHGQRAGRRIWVENIVLRHDLDDVVIATYEEWQASDEMTTQRACTVIFKKDSSALNGLLWLHVHESGLREVVQQD